MPTIVRAFAALLLWVLAAGPLHAAGPTPFTADRWTIYGTQRHLLRDERVPGHGAVAAAARTSAGESWSSGAVVTLPDPLDAGAEVSAVFWARAERPTTVPVALQAAAEPYTGFADTTVALTPAWRRVVLTGTAPTALAAGSQVLVVQLGHAGTAVSLGPVLIMPGAPDAASIDAQVAALRFDRVAEDVTIAAAPGVALAGTLRTPLGHGAGHVPVAMVIAGSGPNGRGGFDLLMDRLLSDGIATFEYDKRGVAQSTGTFDDRLATQIADATAGVAFLRGRRELASDRIALIGHSQGGMVAPAVAARDLRIRAVVMLAGPSAPGKQLILGQTTDQLRAIELPAATITDLEGRMTRLLDARASGADAAEVARLRQALTDGSLATGLATPAQASAATDMLGSDTTLALWTYRPDLVLAQVHAPVLALFGSVDTTVPATTHLPAAKAALAANPDAMVVEIAGVNHGFQHARTGTMAEFKALGAPNSAPEMIKLVGDWLDGRLLGKT